MNQRAPGAEQASPVLLEIVGATRRFGGLVAIDAFSGVVRQGERVGLIGPNGAGKTTLFNLISGFTPLSDGEVRFAGERISGLRSWQIAQLGIARTFQNLRIFPNMTAFDNVSIGAIGALGYSPWLALKRDRAAADRVSGDAWDALERAGLAGQAGELAANLAYGKKKYLEIARALALRPRLLILDEPAAGLNDTETAALAQFVRSLSTQGLTILLVEHDMSFVMSLCDRVMVIASGQKIADGPPDRVANDPAVLEAYLGLDAGAA
jgi:branched-chain amino acid transport system ATP-binding protein